MAIMGPSGSGKSTLLDTSRSNGSGSPHADGSPNETNCKRMRRPYQSKTYKVEISYGSRIPMQAIAQMVLRQQAAKQGCLLVSTAKQRLNKWSVHSDENEQNS